MPEVGQVWQGKGKNKRKRVRVIKASRSRVTVEWIAGHQDGWQQSMGVHQLEEAYELVEGDA